jgi:hypothetical protein
MFDFGKSLINMNPDEQKKMLDNATSGQRNMALEMGIGFNKPKPRQQPKQQKRDAYYDLDRLNTIVEKENEAHDFFGKGLNNWQKNVTGNRPSKDATTLKKQFDDYEHGILSDLPKGGKRHGALSETLPKIKNGFLKQGHQFALDKLNERSRKVLDKGLQRLAKDALEAKDAKDIQRHDDAAFDLINKYVLSEATFDEKDADAMYDTYLEYTGFDLENARVTENDTNTMSDAGGGEEADDVELQIPEKKEEVYEGNQYRGKVKKKASEATSDKASEQAGRPRRQKSKETAKEMETPEQREKLREVTHQVPDSVKEKDKKKGLTPFAPRSYKGRKFNLRPGGDAGPTLTFENDNPKKPSPDLAVHPDLATVGEEIAKETGLNLNINSTTGGEHGSSQSQHYQGKAIDINKINGLPVDHPDNIENVKKLQEAMDKHRGMRECYGPHLQEQNRPESTGRKKNPGMLRSHKTHIHFAVQ